MKAINEQQPSSRFAYAVYRLLQRRSFATHTVEQYAATFLIFVPSALHGDDIPTRSSMQCLPLHMSDLFANTFQTGHAAHDPGMRVFRCSDVGSLQNTHKFELHNSVVSSVFLYPSAKPTAGVQAAGEEFLVEVFVYHNHSTSFIAGERNLDHRDLILT